jgi:hypothetical protein
MAQKYPKINCFWVTFELEIAGEKAIFDKFCCQLTIVALIEQKI